MDLERGKNPANTLLAKKVRSMASIFSTSTLDYIILGCHIINFENICYYTLRIFRTSDRVPITQFPQGPNPKIRACTLLCFVTVAIKAKDSLNLV